jgi:hypothetical protein
VSPMVRQVDLAMLHILKLLSACGDALLVHKGFHSADDASESLSSLKTVRTSKALGEPEFATFQVKKYLNIAASIPHWNLISFLHKKSLERTRANTFSAVRVNPGLCIV